jgi:hypothetical protein
LKTLEKDYRKWEEERMNPDNTFWQYDVKDAMEESISGGRKVKNVRPTINSYMYGNAKALVAMAKIFDNDTIKNRYNQKAKFLKKFVNDKLWDDTASFYKKCSTKKAACAMPVRPLALFHGTSIYQKTKLNTLISGNH